MRILLFTILFLSLAFSLHAQTVFSEPLNTISVEEIGGCAPFTLTITAPNCADDPGCAIDYEGTNEFIGIDPTIPSTYQHTYTEPGIYTINVYYGDQLDKLNIEVYENTAPSFQVSNCGGNNIQLNVTDARYDQYNVRFDDGTDTNTSGGGKIQHAFASEGSKVIEVQGRNTGAANNCFISTQNVTVYNTFSPASIDRVEVINGTDVRLDFTASQYVFYRLEMSLNGSNNFQTIKTFYNESADTVLNLKTEDNYYCFRLGRYNPCTNTIEEYSPVICTPNFDLQVLNNENRLTWSTLSSIVSSQTVQRTNVTDGTSLQRGNINGSSFIDSELICGNEYCYQLILNYPNNSQSISLAKCGNAISNTTPAAITDISTTINADGVRLSWVTPEGFTPDNFILYKSIAGDYGILDTTSATNYLDIEYSTESESCYKIRYVDVCGNESDASREACPIHLTGSLAADNQVNLSWTPYDGYENGVAYYRLEKYNISGLLLETVDVAGTSYMDVNQNLTVQQYVYVISAIPNESFVMLSTSNAIEVTKDPNLFHPTAFTPNGDNLNDIFNVYGQYITEFEMNIFNRWGELMFTTTQLDAGWDGTFKGNDMPEGTYTFVASITDLAGRTFKRSGSVLLLRKK